MKLRDLQNRARDALDADQTLRAWRCRAFAESALDARLSPEPALHAGTGGLSLVVRTPSGSLAGAPGPGGGIPISATLAVDCIEVPGVRRASGPAPGALDAAERAAHLLCDGLRCTFDRFESDIVESAENAFYVYTVYFQVSVTLTP